MEVAQLSELYREAVAVREDAVRASLANSVAQAAAAAAALQAAEPPSLGAGGVTSGADVRRLQMLLAVRGLDLRVDGEFDKDTARAVTEFQESAGLEATGVVDDATWSALSGVLPAARDLAAQALAIIESVRAGVTETLARPGDGLAESLAAESLASESLAAESLAAESLALESTAAETLAAESLALESTALESSAAEPLAAEPLAAEPIAAEPLAAEPLAAEPLAAEPIAAEPLAAEPLAAEPLAAEPIAGEPLAAEPLAAEPLAAEPLAAEPFVAEPLAAEPLTAESTAAGFLGGEDAIGIALRAFIAEHNAEG